MGHAVPFLVRTTGKATGFFLVPATFLSLFSVAVRKRGRPALLHCPAVIEDANLIWRAVARVKIFDLSTIYS